MPAKSRTTPRKPKSPVVVVNSIEAEANGTEVEFVWRGVPIRIDPMALKLGRLAYVTRVMNNERLSTVTRFNALVDVFVEMLGEDQVAAVDRVTPEVWDDVTTLLAFWDEVRRAAIGGKPGE